MIVNRLRGDFGRQIDLFIAGSKEQRKYVWDLVIFRCNVQLKEISPHFQSCKYVEVDKLEDPTNSKLLEFNEIESLKD